MTAPTKLALITLVFATQATAQDRPTARSWLEKVSFTASGTANWVENLSRTSAEPFRRDAETYELSLGASHHRQLAPNWLLHAGADASWFIVPAYDLANR